MILRILGAGGMGEVYQAQDTKLKRVVAIKRMSPRLQQNDGDRHKFLREAQQASAVNHPNVAGIYDVIEEGGEILLIMEYVEGTPLRSRMHIGFSRDEFFELTIQGKFELTHICRKQTNSKEEKRESWWKNTSAGTELRFVRRIRTDKSPCNR